MLFSGRFLPPIYRALSRRIEGVEREAREKERKRKKERESIQKREWRKGGGIVAERQLYDRTDLSAYCCRCLARRSLFPLARDDDTKCRGRSYGDGDDNERERGGRPGGGKSHNARIDCGRSPKTSRDRGSFGAALGILHAVISTPTQETSPPILRAERYPKLDFVSSRLTAVHIRIFMHWDKKVLLFC